MVDNKSNSDVLIPAIRFEGLSGEWEKNILRELCSNFQSGKFIKAEDIQESEAYPVYGGNGLRGYSTTYNHDGAYVLVGRQGALCGNTNLSYGKAFFTEHAIAVQANKNNNTVFLFYKLGKMNLGQYSGQSAQPGLSVNNLIELDVILPKKKEQTKIGQYFQQLDTLIAQHQQKHDKLLNLKKSLLERMFPKQGADEPAIRFKGFKEAWFTSELGDILDIKSAARVHKDEWTNTGVPFFRTSDVVSKHKGLDNKNAFISFELYEELSSKIGYVKKDDLLITGGGSIGIPYLIKTNSPLYFKDADLLWLRNYSRINGYFLLAFFFSQSFRKYIGSITHIGTISHYTIEQAKSTPISISTSEEQTKIGNLFQQLDTLTTQHQTQLKKLTNIKQACLAKLFV